MINFDNTLTKSRGLEYVFDSNTTRSINPPLGQSLHRALCTYAKKKPVNMGCAASAPDSVIDGIVANNNQNAQDTEQISSSPIDNAGQNLNNQIQHSDVLLETTKSNEVSSFQDLEIPQEPIIIKANAKDMLYSCGETDSNGASSVPDVKIGYVAFEVNLDGEVDPTMECKAKPLPKRLKHLAPLDGAPKLTAEELNDKLERAEQKRLKVNVFNDMCFNILNVVCFIN